MNYYILKIRLRHSAHTHLEESRPTPYNPSGFLSHDKFNCFTVKTKEQLRIHWYQQCIYAQVSF